MIIRNTSFLSSTDVALPLAFNPTGVYLFDNRRVMVACLNDAIVNTEYAYKFSIYRTPEGKPVAFDIEGDRYLIDDVLGVLSDQHGRRVWSEAEMIAIEQFIVFSVFCNYTWNLNWSFDLCWDGKNDTRCVGTVKDFIVLLGVKSEKIRNVDNLEFLDNIDLFTFDFSDDEGMDLEEFSVPDDFLVDLGNFNWETKEDV